MKEKKFHIPALVISLIGAMLGYFMLPVEAIAAGGIGLVLSVFKRKTHQVKLSMVLSVIALLFGIAVLGWMTYVGKTGIGSFSYWYYRLFFGSY